MIWTNGFVNWTLLEKVNLSFKSKFFISLILMTMFSFSQSFGQKVAVIGMNHNSSSPNTDGFAFVATEPIPAGEVIYFTENEFDAANGVFTYGIGTTGEGVVKFTVTSALSTGDVVFVNETGTSTNVFTVTCTGGGACGTALIQMGMGFGNGGLSIGTSGDEIYAYSDNDADTRNSIGQIYSVMYTTGGGNIPANESPITNNPNAIIVDGFPSSPNPDRTEYKFNPASNRDGVSQVALENPSNYLHGQGNQALSVVPFTNLNLAGSEPTLTLAAAPTIVAENSGTAMVYTFTIAQAPSSALTVDFTVGGTAAFMTDYNQSGANTFNASAGTVIIPGGSTTATVSITPVGDMTLEPYETVILSVVNGVGYDPGSPSQATGTISNDDTVDGCPLVAVSGINNGGVSPPEPDGFSFVALDDLAAGFEVYFSDGSYNNNNLMLEINGDETVFKWTAPAGADRGDVYYLDEIAMNTFALSCTDGTGAACGTITLESGSFTLPTSGEGFYSYDDTDSNPANGISEIYSVLYTGSSTSSGGSIPANEDPSDVYTTAIVVDGFPSVVPNRTEYNPTLRTGTIDETNFTNTGNWINAGNNQDLSVVPFSDIIIKTGPTLPEVSITLPSSSVDENGAPNLDFVFTLDEIATADVLVNYTVSGTAILSTDYTASGNPVTGFTFGAAAGTVTIETGTNSATVTIDPTPDLDLEPNETIILTLDSGVGYGPGSPNEGIGTILNDDTVESCPLVGITGLNHNSAAPATDGFSFVAVQDITPGTIVYFTENEYDNGSLLFSDGGESVISWVAPSGVERGDVFFIDETSTSSNAFTIDCTDGSGTATCGTVTLEDGDFSVTSLGDELYAYSDDDTSPYNGVSEIYAVLYTGLNFSGGAIPAVEDPSTVYPEAFVIDGFPGGSAPDRTEHNAANRGATVDRVALENISNWSFAQTNQALSTTAFSDISICFICPTIGGVSASETSVCELDPFDLTATPLSEMDMLSNNLQDFGIEFVSFTSTPADPYVGGTSLGTVPFGSLTAGGTTASLTGVTIGTAGTYEIYAILSPTPTDSNCRPSEMTSITVDLNTAAAASSMPTLCINTLLTDITHVTSGATGIGTVSGLPNGVMALYTTDLITISGTPTESGTFNYDIALTGGCGTVSATGTIIVMPDNTVSAASSSPTLCINTALTDITHVTSGATGIGAASGLPSGVMAAYTTDLITISGIPTESGTFNYNIPLTGGCGMFNATGTIIVPQPSLQAELNGVAVTDNNDGSTDTGSFAVCNAVSNNISITTAFSDLNSLTVPVRVYQTVTLGANTNFGPWCNNCQALIGAFVAGTSATASLIDPTLPGSVVITFQAWGDLNNNGVIDGTECLGDLVEFDVTVNPATTVGPPSSMPSLCENTILTDITHATTGVTVFGTAMNLPPGVMATFASNTITISGTPTASGTYNYTIPLMGICGTVNATGTIIVNPTPMVSFNAPEDLCIDAGLQTGLGGGTPPEGTTMGDNGEYSGPGVMDDGNGLTYSFDPAVAGVGVHTLMYEYIDENGCTASATDMIEVFALPVVDFTAPADLCIDAGLQTGLSGGTPVGGVTGSNPDVILSEDFSYADGSLVPNGGWTNFSGTAGDMLVNSGQVIVQHGAPSEDASLSFTSIAGNIFYGVDFMLPNPGSPIPGTDNEYFIFFKDGGFNFRGRVDIVPANSGGDFSVGLSTTGSTADIIWPNDLTYGTTYRLIVRYDQISNIAQLWIDAAVDTDPFIVSDDESDPGTTVTELGLRQSDSNLNEAILVDNLIVGKTFDAVVALANIPPTIGEYSGPGVVDDGNGMTYSFDPALAMAGIHTLTYTYTDANGCQDSAMDDIEVFALPVVNFTAPADLCIDAGLQTGLGGGTPTEGTEMGDNGEYSGPGVNDDGNGLTYSFDPMMAGVGVHTLMYEYLDENGCMASATDMIEVYALPVVGFTALADLCIDAGLQTGLGGGTPPEGTAMGDNGEYSGPGVNDDGNGLTYSFDPMMAGLGVHTLMYEYTDENGCTATDMDNVEVFELPADPSGVSITNSVCNFPFVEGGSFNGFGSACATGVLTFYTDAAGTMGATTIEPKYNQTGPVQILYTRCVDPNTNCESGLVVVGPTEPATCPYDQDFNLSDPCACNDDQTENGAVDGTFSETVVIMGQAYTNICVGPNSTGLIGVNIGDNIPEVVPGQYEISFNHLDGTGYTLEIVDCLTGDPILDSNDEPLVISNVCHYPVIEFDSPEPLCGNDTAIDLSTLATVTNTEDGYNDGNGVFEFMINGVNGSNLDPGAVTNHGAQDVRIVYIPNMMMGITVDPNAPVCTAVIETEVIVNKVDCGVLPWDGGN